MRNRFITHNLSFNMYIDFDKLPNTARVWVYQADRSLTEEEISQVEQALQPALSQWNAHGQPLLASAQIVASRFIVIGVDEGYNLPSGCSIDSSARTVREIGRQVGVDFFDRSAAVCLPDGSAQMFALPSLKSAVSEGFIRPDTLIFNALVKTKAEFVADWQIRAADSWLKRYFNAVSA